jgi:AcrR family transcriptional regulator
MADIADEAGVSPVSIYNHFAGKDALLEIVIREHLEASLSRAEAVFDLELPFEEKLGRLFGPGAGSETGTGGKPVPAPTDEALAGFDWSDGKIRSIYESFVAERQVPFLARFVEQGKAEGAIDPALSTDAILAYFDANMAIYRRDDLLSKGSEYLRSLSRLFFYGILGR